jgi:hypothetical protein
MHGTPPGGRLLSVEARKRELAAGRRVKSLYRGWYTATGERLSTARRGQRLEVRG